MIHCPIVGRLLHKCSNSQLCHLLTSEGMITLAQFALPRYDFFGHYNGRCIFRRVNILVPRSMRGQANQIG